MNIATEETVVTPIAGLPQGARRIKLQPLALGEKTGHHHSLVADGGVALEDAAEMYEAGEGESVTHYLKVTADGISLVHQEHKAHVGIAPGVYEVVIQRENTDWGAAPVRD